MSFQSIIRYTFNLFNKMCCWRPFDCYVKWCARGTIRHINIESGCDTFLSVTLFASNPWNRGQNNSHLANIKYHATIKITKVNHFAHSNTQRGNVTDAALPAFTAHHSHIKYYECEDDGLHDKLRSLCQHAVHDVYSFYV